MKNFLSRFSKGIADESNRTALVAQAIERARTLYGHATQDQAREPILRLQDQYDEAGIDRLELLHAAEEAFPDDPYWLTAIVGILLARPTLSTGELRLLMRLGSTAPSRIEIWGRLFRDCRQPGNEGLLNEAHEKCALALGRYFPDPFTSLWDDMALEDDARRLFKRSLHDTTEALLQSRRRDGDAQAVLRAAQVHFPERGDVRLALARMVASNGDRSPENVALVMEALLDAPEDVQLKLWAAESLVSMPGHSTEGVAMLRQIRDEHREDERVAERLISALKESDTVDQVDVPMLQNWIRDHHDDIRALELLADHFARDGNTSAEAQRVYRLAAARSPRRATYLRLLGRASAQRGEWPDVIEIFDELRAAGEDGEDVILPLATAYASFGRADDQAIQLYRRAIDFGSLRPEVHDRYCQYLFQTARSKPESVARFTASLASCPDTVWPRLGVLSHLISGGDNEGALTGALVLLQKDPNSREALELAGRALANDFSRRQLAHLAGAEPGVRHGIFEEARKLAPDAGPVLMGLVRHRLADGVRDAETAKLLRDVCRQFPEAVDLRVERADVLWELGQKESAAELYRELLARWRVLPHGQLPRGITPEVRARLLQRVAAQVLTQPPTAADLDVLLEAAGEPDAGPEVLLGAARALIDSRSDHPGRIRLLDQAVRLAPGDLPLERALAESHAAAGKPAPSVRLAIRLLLSHKADEDTTELLRSALAANRPQELPPGVLGTLRDALAKSLKSSPGTLLAGTELILSVRPAEAEDLALLERLSEMLPRNVRVRRWLARCLAAAGQDSRAIEVYGSLVDSNALDEEVIVELASTHARLGMRGRENLRLAESAVAIRPQDIDLLFHLAGIELELGHFASASNHLDQVLARAPELHGRVLALVENTAATNQESGRLLVLLARVHIKARRFDEALDFLGRLQANYQRHFPDLMALYGEMIEVAPDNPRPLIERGILHRLSGRIDEAVDDLHRAYDLAPTNPDVLQEYAEVLAQKVRSSSKPEPEVAVEAGGFFLTLGNEEQAREMARLALERDPDNGPGLMLLARLQLAAKQPDACRESIRRMADRRAALPILEQLARVYAEQNDPLRAAEVLTDAIEMAGPQRELLEQLRTLYQTQDRQGRDQTARQKILVTLSDRARTRYELREEIGSGAMGVVFKAYDRELDEIVVLKILPEDFATDPAALARFRHEAKAARKLAHPNIVRIHDFGEDGGRRHISMEYVSGGDLKQFIHEHHASLTLSQRLQIIREVARALAHAHSEGVLHRDIKAANILLTPTRRVKLSDFGIAAILGAEGHHPPDDPNYVFGTPLYMSPEQFRGDPLTRASDLYSVGVLMYELLTGSPPFVKGSIAFHHQYTRPTRIPNLPDPIWVIVERLLEKEPAKRYQRAEDLLRELDQY